MATRLANEVLVRCRVLAGPTACGKSELALGLAERLDAEIVSLDSMAVYRGIDIGTAKPTALQRSRVPHHLLDVVEPHEEYSLADYVATAAEVCGDIVGRGRMPLFVGGSGLYLRGILRGVFDGPQADWDFRHRLQAEAADREPNWLWERLREVDPRSAEQLHAHDARRLVRALEVYELTGRPLSEQQDQPPRSPDQRPAQVCWLSPPREWLYERINTRVESMIEAGLVEEVERLLTGDPPPGRTASQALGYKEIIDYLDRRLSLPDAIDLIQRHTRRFARKQMTWFRGLEECREVAIDGSESIEGVVELVAGSR